MSNLPELFRRNSFFNSSDGPFRDLIKMQRQMDRLFDEVGTSWVATPQVPALATSPAFTPSCDVEEVEGHYLMSFDLPGVKKEDIKVDLQNGLLTVSGERNDSTQKKEKNRSYTERFHGSFQRTFQLPPGVTSEQIEAHYADGVLRIAVPKVEASKTQTVKIGEGKPGFWDKLLGHKKEDAKSSTGPSQAQAQDKRSSVKIA